MKMLQFSPWHVVFFIWILSISDWEKKPQTFPVLSHRSCLVECFSMTFSSFTVKGEIPQFIANWIMVIVIQR